MGDTSAPRVGPFIAHAVEAAGGPIYNYYHDTVCMQAYITANVDPFITDWQNMGICLDIHTNLAGRQWLALRSCGSSEWERLGQCRSGWDTEAGLYRPRVQSVSL